MKSIKIKNIGLFCALSLCFATLFATSCSTEDADDGSLSDVSIDLSVDAMSFDAIDEEAQTFTIETEGVWEIVLDPIDSFDWIFFNKESGKGDTEISVTVDPNRSTMRSAEVKVISGSVSESFTLSQATGVPVETVFQTPYLEGTLMENKNVSELVYIVLPYKDGDGSTYEDITTTTSGVDGVTVDNVTESVEEDGYSGEIRFKVEGFPTSSGNITFSITVPGYDAINFSSYVEEFVEPTFGSAYLSSIALYASTALPLETYLEIPYVDGYDGVYSGVTVAVTESGAGTLTATPASVISLPGTEGVLQIPISGTPSGSGNVTFTVSGIGEDDIVYSTTVQSTRILYNGGTIPNRTGAGTMDDIFDVPYTLAQTSGYGEVSYIVIDAPNTSPDYEYKSTLKDIRRMDWWDSADPTDTSKWGYWEITIPDVSCVSGGYLCFGHAGSNANTWHSTNTKALSYTGAPTEWKISYESPDGSEWIDTSITFTWPCGTNNNFMFVRDYALIVANAGTDTYKTNGTDPILFPLYHEFKNQDIKIRIEFVNVGSDPTAMVFIAYSLNVWYVTAAEGDNELLPANFSTEYPE
ncbi:MAG: BACON domain-containing protein [Rikenellaceae bacterium]